MPVAFTPHAKKKSLENIVFSREKGVLEDGNMGKQVCK